MLFKREKRGRGWLISEACRKARALNQWYQETMSLDDIQYFVWMNANAQNKNKNIQPLHNQLYGSSNTNNPNIVVEIYRVDNYLIDEQVWKKLVLLFVRGLRMIIRRRFFPLDWSAFGRSTCTGKTSLWIFMTPIWAPKNKAWVSISLVEGASAPDDFDVVVVFAAAPLRIFDISRYWAWDATA